MFGIELAGGALIFLGVLIVGFFSVVYGWYTVKGSGISETPYGKIYGGAPGAFGKATASGYDERVRDRDWSRGTR